MSGKLQFECVFRTVDHQLGIQFKGPKRGETVTVFGVDVDTKSLRVSSSFDGLTDEVKQEACDKYIAMTKYDRFERYPK